MRLNRVAVFGTLLLGAAGCSAGGPGEQIGEQAEEVQTSWLGDYVDVDLAPSGLYGEAARATGAVLVPTLDSAGNVQRAADGTPLRGTCGVTFISNKHAITAGHCVVARNVPDSSTVLTVEVYRPTEDLDWARAANISVSGDFTTFSHPRMGSPEYQVERFDCSVVRRCGSAWGQLDCDAPDADVALLRCSGNPGLVHGYVNVANTDLPTTPLEMPWKHEVYSIPSGGELHDHYTLLGARADNIHYFGDDRNQLLPLRSLNWPGGIRRSRTATSPHVMWTDLQGCHGTSGSGVLQERASGEYELLGPVSRGAWTGRLCSTPTSPGMSQIAYSNLNYTQLAAEAADDCLPGPTDARLLLWLSCHRNFFLQAAARFHQWPAPSPCLTCGLIQRLRHHDEPLLELVRNKAMALPMKAKKHARYRFAATTLANKAGATLRVYVGSKNVGKVTLTGGESVGKKYLAQLLSLEFEAPADGELTLVSEADGVLVNGLALIENGALRSFELANDRAGVVTLAMKQEAPVEPSRFVNTKLGLAAQVEAGETMLFTQEALVAGNGYSMIFETDSDESVRCGILDTTGKEHGADCTSYNGYVEGSVQLPQGVQPIAAFVRSEKRPLHVFKVAFKSW